MTICSGCAAVWPDDKMTRIYCSATELQRLLASVDSRKLPGCLLLLTPALSTSDDGYIQILFCCGNRLTGKGLCICILLLAGTRYTCTFKTKFKRYVNSHIHDSILKYNSWIRVCPTSWFKLYSASCTIQTLVFTKGRNLGWDQELSRLVSSEGWVAASESSAPCHQLTG